MSPNEKDGSKKRQPRQTESRKVNSLDMAGPWFHLSDLLAPGRMKSVVALQFGAQSRSIVGPIRGNTFNLGFLLLEIFSYSFRNIKMDHSLSRFKFLNHEI